WARPDSELTAWTKDLVTRIGDLPAEALAACKQCIAAAFDPAQDGFELELSETRRLHDVSETQTRVHAFLDRQA
ncbi:MAG: hypothetical protein OEY85_06055, partial [Rhodospirillales bacterium]|nr:hypothetical protein [Rhodospirillales bacterium]